jgi:hypothetical protein
VCSYAQRVKFGIKHELSAYIRLHLLRALPREALKVRQRQHADGIQDRKAVIGNPGYPFIFETAKRPVWVSSRLENAGSTGRCNTCIKSLCRPKQSSNKRGEVTLTERTR